MSGSVRYRALVSYIGTHFHGWQRQENASRTVQAVLEEAVARFASTSVRTVAAGRTDVGVHADGQVIHFDLPKVREGFRVRDGANALLPWDLKLLAVETASPDFHARRDAAWKEYLYRWSLSSVIPPRDCLFVAPLSRAAEPERMAEAAKSLLGEHDFRIFAVRYPAGESSLRRLLAVSVQQIDGEIRVLFRGEGFLRGMVRSICGVLAEVGRGRVPPGRVAELLEMGDRRLLASKASARGLTLSRVHYERWPWT